jgi:hypothetical protein
MLRTRAAVAKAGLRERITLAAGDAIVNFLPKGCSGDRIRPRLFLYTISMIPGWSAFALRPLIPLQLAAGCRSWISAIRAGLPPGSVLTHGYAAPSARAVICRRRVKYAAHERGPLPAEHRPVVPLCAIQS